MRTLPIVLAGAMAWAGAAAAQTASPAHAGGDPPPGLSVQIAQAVANPFRDIHDVPYDKDRKPGETIAFAGVKPASKVIELAPDDAYYSMMLYSAGGPMGRLYVYTPKATDPVRSFAKTNGGMRMIEKPLNELGAPEHVDVVFCYGNFHAFHNPGPLAADVPTLLKKAYAAMKPGASLVIVDYAAAPDAPAYVTQSLGRIDPAQVIREVQAAGFVLASESNVLANPNDPHTAPAAQMGDKADRMLLKFVKPGVAGEL